MYDDTPAVNVVCPPVPDPKCTESFRQKRIYGDNVTNIVDDTPAESIVARLTKLLAYLDAHYPNDGWGGYLAGGKPNGLYRRQRALSRRRNGGVHCKGQRSLSRRAVREPVGLLQPAPSACSVALQAAGHPARSLVCGVPRARTGTGLMSRTYPALGIPASQRQVLDLEPRPTPDDAAAGAMAYHWSVVGHRATPLDANGIPAYLPVWNFRSEIQPAETTYSNDLRVSAGR